MEDTRIPRPMLAKQYVDYDLCEYPLSVTDWTLFVGQGRWKKAKPEDS